MAPAPQLPQAPIPTAPAPAGMAFGMAGPFIADRSKLPYNGANIGGPAVFMTFVGSFIVLMRLYVRHFKLKAFSWDDAFITVALFMNWAIMACFVGSLYNGGGRHWNNIEIPFEYERLKHWQYAHVGIAILAISVIKISIGLGMLRFLHGKPSRWFCMFMIGFVTVATITTMTPFFAECHPMEESWAYEKDQSKCESLALFKGFADANGILNIVTDFIFVLLPLPTIWKLQVNKRTKGSLLAVLSLGAFAGAAACARLVTGLKPFQINDSPWTMTFFLWAHAELNLGLIAASLPPLRPLVSAWLDDKTKRFRTGVSNGYGLKSSEHSSRNGWQRQHDVPLGSVKDWQKGGGNNTTVTARQGDLGDASSEEAILNSKPKAIMRQTEITMKEDRI